MNVTVYGASDDLIEVDGAISEEFNPPYDMEDAPLMAFSNGVVLKVIYDNDGIWRITPLAGVADVSIAHADPDDEDNYSDRATLLTDAKWVVYGDRLVKSTG